MIDKFRDRKILAMVKKYIRKCLNFMVRIKDFRSGQIKKEHEIGKWISFLSSLPSINTIVEIGTWNGKGSSKAIVRGVMSRRKAYRLSVEVVGYEINPVMAKSASKVLKKYGFFKVVYGSIVTIDDLDRSNLSEVEMKWLKQDELLMENSPNVLSTVPMNIDLLILDGGEFSTFAEFSKLKDRVRGWIILDDTKTRKCSEILRIVCEGDFFEVVHMSDERHGTAILKRLGRQVNL